MEATTSQGILSTGMESDREQLVAMLQKAYFMEIETVMRELDQGLGGGAP